MNILNSNKERARVEQVCFNLVTSRFYGEGARMVHSVAEGELSYNFLFSAECLQLQRHGAVVRPSTRLVSWPSRLRSV